MSEMPLSKTKRVRSDGELNGSSRTPQSAGWSKALFDNMNMAFSITELVYDEQGHAVNQLHKMVNKEFERILGFKAKDIVDQPLEAFGFTKEVIQQFTQLAHDVYRSEKPISFENYMEAFDKHLQIQAFPAGEENRVGWTFMDVSNRVVSENEIKKGKEDYQNLFNSLNSFFSQLRLIRDEKGKPIDLEFLMANQEFLKFLGVTSDQFIGARISHVFPDFMADDNWFELFTISAENNVSQQFTKYAKGLKAHIKCSLFNTGEDEVGINFINVTAEVDAQLELKKLHTQLDLNMHLEKIAYWEWDATTDETVNYNEHWEEVFEIAPVNVMEQLQLQIHEEDSERIQKDFEDHFSQKTAYFSHEYRYYSKDRNQIKWIKSSGQVTERNSKGEPLRVVGSSRDITVEKERELEIEDTNDRLKLAIELNQVAIWEWDVVQDSILNENDHWQQVFELPSKKNISENFNQILFEDDAESTWQPIQDHMAGLTESYNHEFRIWDARRKKVKWLHNSGKVMERDREGNPLKLLGVTQDITTIKEAEQTLLKANADLIKEKVFRERLSESSTAGIYIFNVRKGQNTYLNKKGAELKGYSPEEVMQLDAEEFVSGFHPDDLEMIIQHMESLKDSKCEQTITYRYKVRSGDYRYFKSIDTPFELDEKGDLVSYLGSFIDVTEQKQYEQTLQEANTQLENSNTRLSLSLQLEDLAIWEWDIKNDRIIDANDYWKRIYQFDEEGPAAQFTERVHADDRDKTWSLIESFISKDEPYSLHYRLWDRDKKHIKYVHNTAKVIERDTDGNAVRLLGISKDVTEETLHNDNLSRMQDELNNAQSLSKIGSWYLDVETNEVTWTKEIYRMYGFDPSLPPPPYTEHMKLFTKESWDTLTNHLEKTATQGIPYDLELEMEREHASFGWMRAIGEAVYDEHDRIIGLRGTAQDITESKEKDDELIRTKNLYESLFQNLPLAFTHGELIYDDNGEPYDLRMITLNQKHEELTGIVTKEAEGELLMKVRPEVITDEQRQWLKVIEHTEKTGESQFFEFWSEPYQKFLEVYMFSPQPGSAATIFADVSDKKAIEKELIDAKDAAELANKQKDMFLSNLSHEIRTPMNAIVGFANLLKKPKLDQKKKDLYVQQVNENSKQLLVLLDDIADLTKIESGELQFKEEQIELSQIANQVYETFDERLKDHKTLQIKLVDKVGSKEVVEFFADPTRVKQVLNNLVDNAIKYSDQGTIVLSYSADTETIQFEVKDEGHGIAQNDLERIFNRFEQVAEDEFSTQGSGLGLAISKGIIDKMGGTIGVVSKKGEGSTFTISFPRGANKHQEEATEKPKISSQLATKKILIADDSPSVLLYYQVILEDRGLEIVFAKNGQEALELFNQNLDFDMVFLDIKMPKLNGIEVMKAIRIRDKKLPVIAQTAFALNDEVQKLKDQGFTECINKPIDEENFLRLLGLD